MNSRIEAKIKFKVKPGFKSRFKKYKVVELGTLETLLSYIVAFLRAKSSSNLLKIAELYKKFF